MCGLAGAMSNSLTTNEVGIFKDLLNVASLRGSQGAGVAVVQTPFSKNISIEILRTKHIAGALAYSPEFEELVKPRVSTLIGHARLPTKGGLDLDAVHPHRSAHITGVHNGTMHRVAGHDVKEGESDSALLFKAISEVGIKEAIKESSGAYALVWADEREGTINFLRNNWRPLYFKNVGWGEKNINTLYWSSEQEMLDFVLSRTYKGTNTWDTYLPIDTILSYPLDPKHILKPVDVIADVRPTPPKPVVYRPHGGGNGNHGGGGSYRNRWDDDEWDYEMRRDRRGNPRGHQPFRSDELPWAGTNDEGMRRVLRLPPPDVAKMTKAARKKYEKDIKQEEKQALQRLSDFRRAKTIADLRAAREAKEKDIKTALADLVDDSQDVTQHNDHYPQHPPHRVIRGVGMECAWCGTVAEAGDRVYMTSVDLGSKNFVCQDCGTSNSAAANYTSDAKIATIIN